MNCNASNSNESVFAVVDNVGVDFCSICELDDVFVR